MKSDAVSVLRAPPCTQACHLVLVFQRNFTNLMVNHRAAMCHLGNARMRHPKLWGFGSWSKSSLVLVEGVVAFAPASVSSPLECLAFNEGI